MISWEKFNDILQWIVKIAYLNVLWIVFTAAGLGIFGLFPATGALFTIVHKWYNREPVNGILKTFAKTFLNEFIPLNKYGILFLIFGYMLVYDLLFIQMNDERLKFLYPIIVFIGIIYIVTLLYFFPTYLRFDLKFFQYIKQSFFIGASSIVETMIILMAIMILTIIIRFIPGILPVYSGSVIALVITWCSNRAIERIKLKKENDHTS